MKEQTFIEQKLKFLENAASSPKVFWEEAIKKFMRRQFIMVEVEKEKWMLLSVGFGYVWLFHQKAFSSLVFHQSQRTKS